MYCWHKVRDDMSAVAWLLLKGLLCVTAGGRWIRVFGNCESPGTAKGREL
jgi:hypothetical protein